MAVPLPTTTLLGRDGELRAAREAVRASRLVTLIGPGGVGKTRLAVELLNELDTEFDTVALIEFAHLDRDASLPAVVAHALGVAPPDAAGWRHLDVAPTLLALDNCEHVLDQAAHLATAILQSSRSTRVVTTSRFALDVLGETLIDVTQLLVAAPPGSTDAHGPAVALFVERARSARSDFAPTDADLAVIAGICADLDGIPLAIEIVAALTRAFPLARLAEMVAVDPAALEHRRRDADGRHQSLLANVWWSRSLLDPDDAAGLEALAVFSPDFTIEAAASMIGDATAHRLIANLVQRSLLTHDAASNRYRMLGYVRRTVLAAVDADRRSELNMQRAEWCAVLSARWGCGAAEPETVAPELRTEAGNLQDAAAWCLAEGKHELAVNVIGPMAISWVHMGWPVDPSLWVVAAEQTMRELPERSLTMMLAISFHRSWAGDIAGAVALLDRIVDVAADAGLGEIHANALVQRAHLESATDPSSDRAEAMFDEAIAIYDTEDAPWGRAWARFYLGRWLETRDPERASHVLDESLELIRPHRFDLLEGLVIERQARLHRDAGRSAEALALASRSRELHRSVGYPEGEATSANCEGFIHIIVGSIAAAEACHRSALRIGLSLRHEGIVFESLMGLAVVASRRGRRRLAARLAGAGTKCHAAFAELTARRFGSLPDELQDVLDDPQLASDRAVGFAADPVEVVGWKTDDLDDGTTIAARQLVEQLSDRERTVLALLRGDLTQREIAHELIVAPSTVKSHIKSIYRKLGASSRAEALELARELGLIS